MNSNSAQEEIKKAESKQHNQDLLLKQLSQNLIWFFPSNQNYKNLLSLISRAEKTIHLCVHIFTDETIANYFLRLASRHNVEIKVIADSKKHQENATSVLDYLRITSNDKIQIRIDNNNKTHSMHHKFLLIDNKVLANGSYNYSRPAKNNQENIIVTCQNHEVQSYMNTFNSLWHEFRTSSFETKDEFFLHEKVLQTKEEFLNRKLEDMNEVRKIPFSNVENPQNKVDSSHEKPFEILNEQKFVQMQEKIDLLEAIIASQNMVIEDLKQTIKEQKSSL